MLHSNLYVSTLELRLEYNIQWKVLIFSVQVTNFVHKKGNIFSTYLSREKSVLGRSERWAALETPYAKVSAVFSFEAFPIRD